MRTSLLRITGVCLAAACLALAAGQPALAASTDWPSYHRSNDRAGNDPFANPFSAISQQWISSALDGQVYAEPLVVGNQVIVATENDSIYSLDAASGAPTWAAPAHFGTPVSIDSRFGGCGNVNPLGILGTPVVDTASGIIYAVAFSEPGNYALVGVNLSNGSQAFTPIPINPAGFNPFRQQQRAALTLANGNVYIPFGGYAGDCQPYHGYLIGIRAGGVSTTLTVFKDQPQTPCSGALTPSEAAIWAAPSADAAGNIYLATGNGADTSAYDCGETVFKLSSSLGYLDSWAPNEWASLNASDTDIGSVGPALVGATGNLVFQSGKNGWGYLLNTSRLSSSAGTHIGGDAFNAPVCNAAIASNSPTGQGDQVFGGVAYADPYIYVPCPEGIKAIKLGTGASPSFSAAWSSPAFNPGPPILSGGVLWAIDVSSNILYGLDPATGAIRFSASVGGQTRFSTPAAGQGRIYVADGTSNRVRAFGQGPGQYHPLTPKRIYDSRTGDGPLGAGLTRDIAVAGVLGAVPATGVAAVVMNVTVTNTTASSYLTLYPAGFARPIASNLNWTAGKTIPNLVEVPLGDGGQVTAYNAAGAADIVVDVAGWINQPVATPGPDGLFNPLVPARILDTRNGIGGIRTKIGPGQTITAHVTGHGLVPVTGVEAAILNVTATNPTAPGYLTVFPTGATQPTASNLNFVAGQSVPNRVAVALGLGGQINIYNAWGTVDVVADVNGYFTDATLGNTGRSLTPVAPARILDTRNNIGGFSSPLGPGQRIAVQVAGVSGVPPMTATTPPQAVILNVTVTQPTASGYLTVWPDGVGQPPTSDLNFTAGQTVPNLVVVQLGLNGKVDFLNAGGSTHVVADVFGWY